jgi:hypothetical protein
MIQSPADSCFGFCANCGKVHVLPSAAAILHCEALMKKLKTEKRLDFDLPAANADPALSTDFLYSQQRGKMMGMLVCADATGKEVVLRAFSSKYNGRLSVPGWVDPIAAPLLFVEAIEAGNVDIHPLTALINSLEKGSPPWNDAVAERKKVSHRVLQKIEDLYEVVNFRKETRALGDLFSAEKGIPTGTGDCCAPKLLNHAAKNNLVPLSMAEFFWGRESASGKREEGAFYESCTDKC